jgi:phospholipase/carboxylesterase
LNVGRAAAGLSVVLCSAATLSCWQFAPVTPAPADVAFRAPTLTAIVNFPAGYDSARTYPLLVALHGLGGIAAEFDSALRPLDRASLLVAVPEAEYARRFGGGFSWFLETSDRSRWEANDARSVDHLVELIGAIGARYRIGRVFVFGFSQGATMAYLTALRNPALVTGVLAVGGGLPEVDREGSLVHAADVERARAVKVFIARGRDDPYLTPRVFTGQRDFLVAHGYGVTTYDYAGAHYLTGELLARMGRWIRRYGRN